MAISAQPRSTASLTSPQGKPDIYAWDDIRSWLHSNAGFWLEVLPEHGCLVDATRPISKPSSVRAAMDQAKKEGKLSAAEGYRIVAKLDKTDSGKDCCVVGMMPVPSAEQPRGS